MTARTEEERVVADAIEHAERGMRGVRTLSMAKAITAGLREAMRADDRVILMGEDIGPLGGVFRVTEGLSAEFGDRRVLDTPLAESGIVGAAIGLAMRGRCTRAGSSARARMSRSSVTAR